MGFRFRKSVKAGPFRMTFSKSGVGYSVGGKGFRVTKKAKGGIRTTASIPGTGLSYSNDFGRKGRKASYKQSARNVSGYQSAPMCQGNDPWGDRFCGTCGVQIVSDTRFCGNCGAPFTAPSNYPSKKLDIKKWLIIIPSILFAILILSCIEVKDPDKSTVPTNSSANKETQATTAPPEAPDAYHVVDTFISMYNDSASPVISEIKLMDIRGEDYETEFRLNAFRNAVGKKGTLGSGTIKIMNFGSITNDELRVYAYVDSFDAAISLYVIAAKIDGKIISDSEIAELYRIHDSTGSVTLHHTLTGYIFSVYSNGGIVGYNVMLDSFSLNFVS